MVLLEGDCQIPVLCGREQIGPRNMARIWPSEPSAPENSKEPKLTWCGNESQAA